MHQPASPVSATLADDPTAADPTAADRQLHFRTIWISDLHLGTKGANVELLLDFLRSTRSERMYLVGDILDGWRMSRAPYWSRAQGQVLHEILQRAQAGTRVIYLPGNHDEVLRNYLGVEFAGVRVANEWVHETADGRRLLVLHGDRFDGVMQHHRWLALLGDHAYRWALRLNTLFNRGRRLLRLPYWSLSMYLKHRVKNAVDFIFQFEATLAEEARRRGFDGVVCGHIHKAELRDIEGVLYANDGDWVESCTALVEHADGALEILDWPSLLGDPRAARELSERATAAHLGSRR